MCQSSSSRATTLIGIAASLIAEFGSVISRKL